MALTEQDVNEQAGGSEEEKSEWDDVNEIHEKILGIFEELAEQAGEEESYTVPELQDLIGNPLRTRLHLDDMVDLKLLAVYEDSDRGRLYSLRPRGRRCIVEKGL